MNLDELENINWSKRRELHVYLGSAICKFQITDLPGTVKEKELQTVAAAQMAHRLGLNIAEWEFTCQADRRNNKIIICASRRAIVDRIKSLAKEKRLKLSSLKPFAAVVWNEVGKIVDIANPGMSLIVAENDALTTFTAKAGILQAMNSFYHRQEAELINREVKRLQLSATAEHSVGIAVPAALRHIAASHLEKVLQKPQSASNRGSDFTDMLLCDEAGNTLDD